MTPSKTASTEELANKPLVEAILEVHWKLESPSLGVQIDPNYKLLLGRLYDRVLEDYPCHEPLPQAALPDEAAGYLVQHRFRASQRDWPVLQVGPGVLTVNDTDKYRWPDFRSRCISAVDKLFDAYPGGSAPQVNKITLRYVDAIAFDEPRPDVFAFLREKMKVNVELPTTLFDGTDVRQEPAGLNWQSSFRSGRPKGTLHLRLATGRKEDSPALIWETVVQSAGDDVPQMPSEFQPWLDEAHDVTHKWFFRLIKGELERRFRGG